MDLSEYSPEVLELIAILMQMTPEQRAIEIAKIYEKIDEITSSEAA